MVNIIKFVLARSGLTREQLAAMTGRTVMSIWRWEHRNVSIKKSDLEKLAAVIDMKPSELLKACGE